MARKFENKDNPDNPDNLEELEYFEELEELEDSNAPKSATLLNQNDNDYFRQLWEESPLQIYEHEQRNNNPLIAVVQKKEGVYVQFAIDEFGQVTGRQGSYTKRKKLFNEYRRKFVEALSEYIVRSGAQEAALQEGEWVNIPCVMPMAGQRLEPIGERYTEESLPLLHIACELYGLEDAKAIGKRIKTSKHFLRFGILLPSGDVINAKLLLKKAKQNKHATKAATLRLLPSASEIVHIAGDEWCPQDWKSVKDSLARLRKKEGKTK